MNTLATILLTILVSANIFIISVIALAIRNLKDKSSYMGSMVLLAVLVVDTLEMIGGATL